MRTSSLLPSHSTETWRTALPSVMVSEFWATPGAPSSLIMIACDYDSGSNTHCSSLYLLVYSVIGNAQQAGIFVGSANARDQPDSMADQRDDRHHRRVNNWPVTPPWLVA